MLFVAKYIPLTIFVVVIGFFNISLLNGTLNSFVVFNQLLPFMDIYAGGRINIVNEPVVETYRFLYDMWNLNFFEIPYSKKLWRSKSLAKRATARYWRKKLWRKVCSHVPCAYQIEISATLPFR